MPAKPASPRGKSGLLADIGLLLHGDNYVKPLAATIGRTRKQVQRYLQDRAPIPDEVWKTLDEEMDRREAHVIRLRRRMPVVVGTHRYFTEFEKRIK